MAAAVPVAATAASVTVYTGRGILMGIALKESAGSPAAARINIRDGTTNAGPVIMPVNFAASESPREWFGDAGIQFNTGLRIEVLAGTIEGALILK